jgi:hypothetical protein
MIQPTAPYRHLKHCKKLSDEGAVLLADIKSLHKEIFNGRGLSGAGADEIKHSKELKETMLKVKKMLHEKSDKHEALGARGMAARAARMKKADFPKWDKLSEQYTTEVLGCTQVMQALLLDFLGVFKGMDRLMKEKAELGN